MQVHTDEHDQQSPAGGNAHRTQHNIGGRAIVPVAAWFFFIVCLVASIFFRGDKHFYQIAVDLKLPRWSLAAGMHISFVELWTQIGGSGPNLQPGDHLSVHFNAGGSDWRIIQSYALPKKFFGGTAEGVTHAFGAHSESLIFTGRNVIKRTKTFFPFETEALLENAIPTNFSSKAGGGYNHIGDVSTIMYNGKEVLLTSVEEPTYSKPLMMMFSADTLAFMHACALKQRHSSFLAVDAARGVMFSSEFMDVRELKRYAFPSCAELDPLPLFRDGAPLTLQGVQGAAVDPSGGGARLYLSTNQLKANRGDIFAVSTSSGSIELAMDVVCGLGLAEVEGLDVWEAGPAQLGMLLQTNFPHLWLSTLTELRLDL